MLVIAPALKVTSASFRCVVAGHPAASVATLTTALPPLLASQTYAVSLLKAAMSCVSPANARAVPSSVTRPAAIPTVVGFASSRSTRKAPDEPSANRCNERTNHS